VNTTAAEPRPSPEASPTSLDGQLAALPPLEAVIGQARSENFPVALWILGPRRRAQLRSLYGFARLVDDVGDEAPGDRLALLDAIEADLDRIYQGRKPAHPVMRNLKPTIAALELPDAPFRRLIDANRRDQLVRRYETFDALLEYCQLSAAPVGELVLHVFGAATDDRIRFSDQICAGLQITEHLQDVAEDHARGRVYLPSEDLERFGCGERDLVAAVPTEAFRAVMALESARARSLLSDGAPLIRSLNPAPALAVAAFLAGGRAALDALDDAHYALATHPRAGRRSFAAALGTTLWRRA
jgi:squalene synthase HpnC